MGDYTRLLAQECIRQGQQCYLVALNDWHVTEPTAADCKGLTELRLPSAMPWPERIQVAREALDAFGPEWVSLQFVPYAFHPKGFVWSLGRRLRPLLTRRRVQVMFHELWLGEMRDAPVKHRLVGTLQKALVRQMLRQIAPKVVHTSNCAYVGVLAQQGVLTSRLPLFGSIPVTMQHADEWLFAEMSRAGIPISAANRNKFWLLGFFGSLPPAWPPEPLIEQLRAAAAKAGRQVVLLSAGQMRSGEALWAQMVDHYRSDIAFVRLGPQLEERISEYFNSLDFGIAVSPWSLIGKSSSVVAMLEHSLPVIVNRNDEHFEPTQNCLDESDPLLYLMDQDLSCKLLATRGSRIAQSRLPSVAQQFLHDISIQISTEAT